MTITYQLNMVREFRTAFQLPIHDTFTIPEDREIHYRLIKEEFDELIEAKDALGEFDALLDLQYVTLGAALDYGAASDLGELENHFGINFPDVLLSNKRLKAWDSKAKVLDHLAEIIEQIENIRLGSGVNRYRFSLGFAEVHRSNMSKMWTDMEVDKLRSWPHEKAITTRTNDGPRPWVVKRYGKVIKSPSYSPANLQPILEAR